MVEERPALVVLEFTDGYERPAAAAIAAVGIAVAVINPSQQARGDLAKTDRIDEQILARFSEAVMPEPRGRFRAQTRSAAYKKFLDKYRQLIVMLFSE